MSRNLVDRQFIKVVELELGCVDSFDPESCCRDTQHREIGSGSFLVAGCDATELLETINAPFNQVAPLVCFAIIFDQSLAV